MKTIRRTKQPVQTVEDALRLFADLHREGSVKHDDRQAG